MSRKSFTSLVLVFVMLFSTFIVVTAQSDKNHGNKTANGWEVLGPGGGGLNVNPVVSPHDPNTVLLSCDMTGSYITHDGGESWRQFNLRTRVDAWGFDPVDKNTIYAGTTGLFRSTDNGDTWKLVFPDPTKVVAERAEKDFSGASFDVVDGYNWPDSSTTAKLPWIHAVEVNPLDANQIYILLSNSGTTNRLYYSGDKGATWVDTGIDTGMNVVRDGIISKIYFDPTSSDGTIYIVAYDGNIFKVKKTGETTWSSTTIKPQGFIRDVAVGVDKSTSPATTAIYITETKNVGGSIILKSNDGGATWAEVTNGLNLANKNTYVYRISTPYTDASVVYMTADNYVEPDGQLSWGVFKYTASTNMWESVLKNVNETYAENYSKGWNEQSFGPGWQGSPKFMNVAPNDSNIVYVSDMAMTYATKDGGSTWGQVYTNKVSEIDGVSSYRTRGIDVTTTYNIAFDPFDKKNMFVSYTDVGAFRSVDDGKSWIHSTKGIPQKVSNTCYWAEYDPEVQGRMWSVWCSRHDLPRLSKYANNAELTSATNGGVYTSNDGGATWTQSGTGLPWNSAPTHILIDPTSSKESRTLYVSVMGRGVYKSTDGGNTWSLKNNGLGANLNAFRITRTEDGTLYLVVVCQKNGITEPGDVYKSTDGAETWTKLSRPTGVYFPTDLVVDPTDENHLYLSAWPATYNDPRRTTFGGVYESLDGGATWTEILNDSYHVYSLTMDYKANITSNNRNDKKEKFVLYATTHDCSVLRSEDGGKTWERLSGANFRWNQRVFMDPNTTSKLYITTFGGSVWYGSAIDTHTGVEDSYPIPYVTEDLEYPAIINN